MPYYKKLLLTLFFFPTLLLCVAAYIFNSNGDLVNSSAIALILIIISILIFAVLLITSMNFIHQERQRHFLEQLLQQREMDLTYYEDVSKAMLQVSKLRHDFSNHLILIREHITHNEPQLALDYINEIANLSHNPVEDVFTNNETISAVLNVKRTECANLNIPLKLNLDFPYIYQLSDIHIVAILGNLLDNAITATSKLPEQERNITLTIRQVDTYLDITCQNSFDGVIVTDNNGFPKSQKHSGDKQHGLGLLNINDAISEYGGDLKFHYANHVFTVAILIPNHD